jgi:arylsulfatase A-like enzyme
MAGYPIWYAATEIKRGFGRMRHVLLFSIVALAIPVVTGSRGRAAEKRPNVLFIAVDDQNDWIGCLRGHPQVQTPNIDRLARRGTLFTNAHCQAPLCNPSRSSLLTGLRPTTTGIYALVPGIRAVTSTKDAVTLPQFFRAHRYWTASSGKVFHDGSLTAEDRTREFEVWGSPGPLRMPAEKFVHTPDDMPLMDWGVFPDRDEDQPDWKIADSAIAHLEKAPKDRPFFVAAGFRLPHVPCFATRKWFDLYPDRALLMPEVRADDRDDVPAFSWFLHWNLPEPRLSWLKGADQWRPLVRAYLASISFMDSQVGRVLDALDATGRAEETVVVLWSDHGWHLGEKGISGKNTLWERSTRVPLVFAGPSISRGATCVRPAELLDLYPTLIELCGLAPRYGLEGHSLVPQLKDASAPRPWPAMTTHNRGNHSVRSERWRYIRYADGTEELYDHGVDPREWKNLASDPQYLDVKREHARWLPAREATPAPGSAVRFLSRDEEGIWYWEGRPIVPGEGFREEDRGAAPGGGNGATAGTRDHLKGARDAANKRDAARRPDGESKSKAATSPRRAAPESGEKP